MEKLVSRLLCASALMCSMAAQAATTVVNGGFESGDFNGWSLTGDADYNVVASDLPHLGNNSAFFGQTDTAATLTQTLDTVIGQKYTVSFWLSNLGGGADNLGTANSFAMLIDGATVISVQDKTATNYTLFEQVFTANTSLTSLAFRFQHDEAFWLLDDVAIKDVAPIPTVPEPSSILMLMLGLGALALRVLRLR